MGVSLIENPGGKRIFESGRRHEIRRNRADGEIGKSESVKDDRRFIVFGNGIDPAENARPAWKRGLAHRHDGFESRPIAEGQHLSRFDAVEAPHGGILGDAFGRIEIFEDVERIRGKVGDAHIRRCPASSVGNADFVEDGVPRRRIMKRIRADRPG